MNEQRNEVLLQALKFIAAQVPEAVGAMKLAQQIARQAIAIVEQAP
jgi:hypothetical protein